MQAIGDAEIDQHKQDKQDKDSEDEDMNKVVARSIQHEPILLDVSVDDRNTIHWYCPGGEEDEQCGQANEATLHDLVYRHPGQARGAVIDLPRCRCGARTFLKADYTLKELYKCLQIVSTEESSAYVLPLRYVANLHIHALLHQSGKAEHAPVLDMPPQALLEHEAFANVKPSTVAALWLGYSAMKAYRPQELARRPVLLLEEGV